MRRLISLVTIPALLLVLLTGPAGAAVRANDEVLFTADEPARAMEELEDQLAVSVTDRTPGGVGIQALRLLEQAVNLLSADLVREAAVRLHSRYGVTAEIVFTPYSGQSYVGLTSLVADRARSYCTVELVEPGLSLGTVVHELCHLLNFAMLDDQAVSPTEAVFSALNGGLFYQEDYERRSAGGWQQYTAALGASKDFYFVSDYAMTNVYEDFACLFQHIAEDSGYWESTLLLEGYAPLRAKYTAAVGLIESSFAGGASSPLGDLFPAAWAVDEWRQAKALGLVPESLDRAYDTPVTRGEFSLLMVNLLRALWGEEPAAVLAGQGLELALFRFPDTGDENAAVLRALGVVDGREDGTFDPDAPITRQEAAKLLTLTAQAAGRPLPAGSPGGFSDASSASPWALEPIAAVSAAGIMTGTGGGSFSPRAAYDRQQSFLTVLRLYRLAGGL